MATVLTELEISAEGRYCIYILDRCYVVVFRFCIQTSESLIAHHVLSIRTSYCLIRKAVRYFAAFYLAEFWFS